MAGQGVARRGMGTKNKNKTKLKQKGKLMTSRRKDDNPSERYYTFSPKIGRRRVPAEHSQTPDDAVQWAKSAGGHNVTREEGPSSKVTDVYFIWKLELA